MTRLALFLPSLRGGGAERVMLLLANGFAERGHEVDLVLSEADGPYLKEVSERVRVIDLASPRVSRSLLPLVRYLRSERPSALLSAMSHVNVLAVLALTLARTPTKIFLSEHAHFSTSRKNARSRIARAMGLMMRWAYPRADAIAAVSQGVADDLATSLSLDSDRITTIYNPVVTEALISKSLATSNHSWLTDGKSITIIGAGRLVPQKDFATLIRALSIVRKTFPARLIILGEGELRPSLESLVIELGLDDAVDLAGFVENPFSIMQRASLFALSSRWEGFGNVLVEAMACGLPVVSTDCPSGPAEILENGKWGRLVSIGDEHALAQAMLATLRDSEQPDVRSRAAQFNVDQAVNGYLKLMLPDDNSKSLGS